MTTTSRSCLARRRPATTTSLGAIGLLVLLAPASASVGGADPEVAAARVGTVSGAAAPEGIGAQDWSSIRAAYEANRHAAFAVAGGFEARNPGQRWRTSFDGRGFLTVPDAGGWTWGLELESYGFAGSVREVCEPACSSALGPRVAYDWDATLQEWWINDARGLEHGYTLRERPTGAEAGLLTLELAVRGDLIARVQADGRGVSFTNADDASVLTYAGLVVFDADGQELPAHFEPCIAGLRLAIDERGARYPLKIDPVAQQAYLKASNTGLFDGFGTSVSVSGDTVIVGAPYESSNAFGVNGNQADNSASQAGAAYVFVRSGTTWTQQAYLKASNTEANDRFGGSVAASGDTVVVGAYAESSNATGVNGNQADNSLFSSGAAYVFVRNGTTWAQQAYLKASNPGWRDTFGLPVSVSGDTVVIGAWQEDSNATGVDGNSVDDSADAAGAAYVFVRSGASWTQEAYLKASNTDALDYFGLSLSVSGDTVVVGAFGESSGATGVNGIEADNSVFEAGSAYVFVRSGTTWTQQAYLKASNTDLGDAFGASVSVSGDTLVVGARGEDSHAAGVDGNPSDDSLPASGAAYIFVRHGATWSQEAYLKASNPGQYDSFGDSVSVSGDTVVVGAKFEDSNATGSNGNQGDESAYNAGAAYVFARNGLSWSQRAYLKASNTGAGDFFGGALSVSDDTIVVGAEGEASNATGVNGNQANNNLDDSGAAYVFALLPEPVAFCFGDGSGTACPCGNASTPGAGEGCRNSLGVGARLGGTGLASVSNDSFVLHGANMPDNSALYFQGSARLNGGLGLVFGDGLRCVGGSLVRLGTKLNVGNASHYPSVGDLSISARSALQGDALSAGTTRHYLIWYRNAAAFCTPSTFNLSNGLSVTWSS